MTRSSDLERENRALRAAGSDSVPGHPSNGRLRIAMTRAVSSAAFALLLGCAAILAGCGSSGGSAPSASEPEVMATPVPASAPVAEVRAEPSPSATAPAITAVTAGPSPPAATPAPTPAPTRSVTPPAQPTRSPGPTPEATLAAVKTAAPTAAPTPAPTPPEPTKEPSAGKPTTSSAAGRARAPGSEDSRAPEATPGQDAALEAVVRNAISNLGAVYTWQDGEHTRRVRLVPALTVQGSASTITSDVVLANDGVRSIVQRQARHGSVAGPVFLAESGGGLMLLPGGVVLALDPEWDEAHVDRFFSDSGIARSRVTRGEFAENGFLVETEAGFASLTLANALAGKAGVLFSVPNWQRESVPR